MSNSVDIPKRQDGSHRGGKGLGSVEAIGVVFVMLRVFGYERIPNVQGLPSGGADSRAGG